MKIKPEISENDKKLLQKRGFIESIGAILKKDFDLEHSRHRSIQGFFSNLFSVLCSYILRVQKPSIARFFSIS